MSLGGAFDPPVPPHAPASQPSASSASAHSQTAPNVTFMSGAKIIFPEGKKPFPQQLAVMGRIIAGAESLTHCLLESPTGTGKTLALLCSSLAWQKASYAKLSAQHAQAMEKHRAVLAAMAQMESAPGGGAKRAKAAPTTDIPPPAIPPKPSKIFFTSRTHSQLTQAIRALKTCHPDMLKSANGEPLRMVLIGSRDQMCINPKVSHLRSGELNDACKDMVAADQESSYGAPNGRSRGGASAAEKGCSYYSRIGASPLSLFIAREIMDIEDLVSKGKSINSCPYFASREALKNADIVFAPYNYLVDVSIRKNMKLDEFVRGAIVIIDEAHNIESVARDASSFERAVDLIVGCAKEFSALSNQGPSEEIREDCGQIKNLLNGLIQWTQENADSGRVFTGHEALLQWQAKGLTLTDVSVRNLIESRASMDALFNSGREGGGSKSPISSALAALVDALLMSLKFMTMDSNCFARDFRVTATSESRPGKSKRDIQLNIWCLNPGVAFLTLVKGEYAARSVVLTSGTLSPLPALQAELAVEFKHQLELMHVVNVEKQVLARVLPRIGSENLDSSYKNAERVEYQDALGHAVLELLKSIPGGVLMFASSYAAVDRLQARWVQTGVWAKIHALKPISVEPKGTGGDFDRTVLEYRRNASKPSGAFFLAVFRGKLSEGIDFVDDMCRAVIVLGMPFPNFKDTKVAEKKAYQDLRVRAYAQGPKVPGIIAPLSGNEWYVQQAHRALNQAIGRVIRHINDYGSIIFLDQRFMQSDVVNGLSKWVRGAVRPSPSLGALSTEMRAFFEDKRGAPVPPRHEVSDAAEVSAGEDDDDDDDEVDADGEEATEEEV